MDPMFVISEAKKEDEDKLVALINCAFGGFTTGGIYSLEDAVGGWTDEKELFEGARARLDSNSSELPLLRGEQDNVTYLKAEEENSGKIIACVKVEMREYRVAYIGILSVLPAYQSKGIGSKLLAAAEELAKKKDAEKITMTTIAVRDTLVDYYIKRGYHDTGARPPFPYKSTDVPTRPLEFVILEKYLVK